MRKIINPYIISSFIVFFIGITGVAGHMMELPKLITWGGDNGMALPTCIGFLLMGFNGVFGFMMLDQKAEHGLLDKSKMT